MDLTKMSVDALARGIKGQLVVFTEMDGPHVQKSQMVDELARRLSETQAELTSVRASLAAAQAIVEKLPKSAEGIPITSYTQTLWRWTNHKVRRLQKTNLYHCGWTEAKNCYLTREAAQAAQHPNGGRDE